MTNIISADVNGRIIAAWVEEALAHGHHFIDIPIEVPLGQEYHRSCFQKAVRRGQVANAIMHGEWLALLDEKYAWTTLSVTAAEDVGIGCPTMVALSLLCTLKTFRAPIGQDKKLFRGIITRLCNAHKNRFGCQLNVFVDTHFEGFDYSAVSDETLGHWLTSPDLGTQFRALRELRKRCKHGNIALMTDIVKAIKQTFPNPILGMATALMFERYTDDLDFGLAVTMAWVFGGVGGSPELTKTNLPKLEDPTYLAPGDLLINSLDQHTSLGRSALVRWAKTTHMINVLDTYGIAPDKRNKALGAITFFHDAAVVYPMLNIEDSYVTDLVLKQEVAYTNSRAEAKLSMQGYCDLRAEVMSDISNFNEIRSYLWAKNKE
ncbi:hypothetical protein EVC30_128 [Rhizobium phage RHph_Y1_11]|nr:hypothetical protein EVC30_128 [Rhizobium phage RHph_Y1_11]